MLTEYFKSRLTIDRYRSGLVGPYLNDFITWLEDLGYARITVRRCVREVVHFGDWFKTEGLTIRECDRRTLDKQRLHLEKSKSLRYSNGSYNKVYQSARLFVGFLEASGVVGTAAYTTIQDPVLWREFSDWMRIQRGTLDTTLANYRMPIISFLRIQGTEPKLFTAKGLREFLLQQMAHLSQSLSKRLATAMRMFLRFLIARGDCATGLDHAIPTVASWRLSSLPKHLHAKDVERLIDSCDQSLPLGARDRAILLLIARLGLRASDVSKLKFDDLQWTDGMIIVSNLAIPPSLLPSKRRC